MFDWIKKRKTKTRGKEVSNEQPEVVEKRDYLFEWNLEHPEEFMDLRLRTIEDEMYERQIASDTFTVDENAWVSDHVCPPPGTVDNLAGGDCPEDCKVPLFEAHFKEVVFHQPVESARLTRSASLPVLEGISVDDPVHVARNHRRYKRRRCEMAADPAFLRDLHSVHRAKRDNLLCSAVLRC